MAGSRLAGSRPLRQDGAMRTVTVSGHGESLAVPDSAVVRVAAVHRAAGVADALAGADSAARQAVTTAREHTTPERIGSTAVQIWPTHDEQGVPSGFEATHSLTIRCADVDAAGALLTALAESVAERLRIEGVSLEVADPSERPRPRPARRRTPTQWREARIWPSWPAPSWATRRTCVEGRRAAAAAPAGQGRRHGPRRARAGGAVGDRVGDGDLPAALTASRPRLSAPDPPPGRPARPRARRTGARTREPRASPRRRRPRSACAARGAVGPSARPCQSTPSGVPPQRSTRSRGVRSTRATTCPRTSSPCRARATSGSSSASAAGLHAPSVATLGGAAAPCAAQGLLAVDHQLVGQVAHLALEPEVASSRPGWPRWCGGRTPRGPAARAGRRR